MNQAQAQKANLGSPLIRCVLVDDHALLRQGVRRILQDEPDFEVVGEASDGGEALKIVIQQRPSLVLMDIGMPGPSSFDTAQQIQKASPQTKVVFLQDLCFVSQPGMRPTVCGSDEDRHHA